MGTRARVNVFKGNTLLVSIYRQFDGYPDGLGKEVAEFAGKLRITTGIAGNPAGTANGMGCFAAQLVSLLKKDRANGSCVGNVYIRDTGPESHGEEFSYNLREKDGRVWIDALEGSATAFGNPGDSEAEMKPIFSGFASDFKVQSD